MKVKFYEVVSILAKKSKIDLYPIDLEVYESSFSDDWETALVAIKQFYTKVSPNHRMPSVDDLRKEIEIIKGTVDDRGVKILESIMRNGQYGYDQATRELGEEVMEAIYKSGGWVNVCKKCNDYDIDKIVKSIVEKLPSKEIVVRK